MFVYDQTIKWLVREINVEDYGVLNKINEGKINADIIVCGTSRSLKAVNPEIIEQKMGLTCFNISSDGSDLGVQIPKLKWYLTNNKVPKIIIQDLSFFGGSISKIIFKPFKYLPYLDNESLYHGLLSIDQNLWKNKYFFPANLLYYNFDFGVDLVTGLLKSFLGKEIYIKGFFPDNSKWTINVDEYLSKNQEFKCRITSEFKKYLNELINICIKNDIKLVLVSLPIFYKITENAIGEKEIAQYYHSLEKNNQNIFFFDYNSSSICRDTTNFYNFSHMNLCGAKKLSTLLARDLLTTVPK
ncbi:MAG: hypothetical protein CR986_03615 [Ignavibacteriae bacterium]|nr:MAG: hypothetical protein CR986_03615 [Ignavibacteriota bacterium]